LGTGVGVVGSGRDGESPPHPPVRTRRAVFPHRAPTDVLGCLCIRSGTQSSQLLGHACLSLRWRRVSLAGRAHRLGPFPPQALPCILGTTRRSATQDSISRARRSCFAWPTRSIEAVLGFPSSRITPFPTMPRASTPADSPVQSPWPTPTGAFPYRDTVGICANGVTGLNRFTVVAAWWSLCLRFVVVVTSFDARLDSRWLAGPCRGGNPTLWTDGASLGAPLSPAAPPETMFLFQQSARRRDIVPHDHPEAEQPAYSTPGSQHTASP
jgi:hypothetical protein